MKELQKEAEDYLGKHRIHELWTHLGAQVAIRKPACLSEFLIQELQRLKEEGPDCGL
jgi:hypothetical protein